MTYTSTSDLKYIDAIGGLDAIPISGFDIDRNWSDQDKLDAAEAGEAKLEGDVNDGAAIDQSDVESIHGEAAAAWATYRLVLGMKTPDSQTRGDASDEGSERMAFADRIKSMYDEYVATIREAVDDEGSPDRQVYTTHGG